MIYYCMYCEPLRKQIPRRKFLVLKLASWKAPAKVDIGVPTTVIETERLSHFGPLEDIVELCGANFNT